MNTIEQEIRSQIENAAHRVVMPEVRRLDELFESISVVEDVGAYCKAAVPAVHKGSLTPGDGVCEMAGFVSVRGAEHGLHVVPRPEVLESISREMLMSDGYRINFGITIRAGGRCALVEAHHSRIISSRWYAIVDADQVRALCDPASKVG